MIQHLKYLTASVIETYKESVRQKEEAIIELNRQEILDLTDMTLPDLKREHQAVTKRLEQKIYNPEGKELLQERQDNLLRTIKKLRRRK